MMDIKTIQGYIGQFLVNPYCKIYFAPLATANDGTGRIYLTTFTDSVQYPGKHIVQHKIDFRPEITVPELKEICQCIIQGVRERKALPGGPL